MSIALRSQKFFPDGENPLLIDHSIPETQYGGYVVMDPPEPSKEMIRQAKKWLIESIRLQAEKLKKRPARLKFILSENYEVYDPETEETRICSAYGWKAVFR